MDLNNIQLNGAVLGNLYADSLVDIHETTQHELFLQDEKKQAQTAVIDPELKSLGENRKNILVLVNYSNAVHIPDEQLDFLTSMLSACKLNLGDVAVFNENNKPGIGYKELLNFYQSTVVLLFGPDPLSLGLPVSFPEFQIQPFNNTLFLFAPPLEIMENDKVLKSKLWVCLRKIFNI